ncbi:MAG: hypothetical protein KAS02_02635 [Candidatus Pacebacteria bacterium]|nr:hypothetical protein [Candidatus Paceibacterota bacterium]
MISEDWIKRNEAKLLGAIFTLLLLLFVGSWFLTIPKKGPKILAAEKHLCAKLAEVKEGDMVVATNSDKSFGYVLVVTRHISGEPSPRMRVSCPIGGQCAGANKFSDIAYSTIAHIIGENGKLRIIPQKNIKKVINGMLEIPKNLR